MESDMTSWRRGRLVAVLLAVMACFASAEASAQARSTFTGTVVDGAGVRLSGVTVAAEGGGATGGLRQAVTNGRGVYRLSDLPPGEYELTATLQGFQTVKRVELRLPVGTTLTIDLTLRASATPETVTLRGASPVVDVTTAASSVQFGREELESLPISSVGSLVQLAPGVTRASAFGSGPDTNQVMIDGSPSVLTAARAARPGVDVHPYWMDEAQIVSLAADAGFGEFSGVVANIAVRSGGRRASGLLDYRATPPSWVADNTGDLPDALRAQFRPQEILSSWTTNAQVGGPIVPGRIFFFTGFHYIANEVIQAGTIGNVPTEFHWPNFLTKLNWVASSRVRVEGFVQRERFQSKGALAPNQLPETAGESSSLISSWNGRLTWIANSRTTVDVRSNGLDSEFESLPGTRRAGPPSHRDRVTNILSGNAANFADNAARRILAGVDVRRSVDGRTAGSHELAFGLEHDRTEFHWGAGFPGGRSYTDASGVPEQVILWNGDTGESTGARTTLYAQDVWSAGSRLSIHAGLRVAFNRGSVPDKGTVFETNPVSPRIGIAWDVAPDHKTVVRAGYGRFHEGLYPQVFDFLNTSGLTPQITARVIGPENFLELQRTATVSVALDDRVAHASVDQFLAGIERELFPSMSLKAQYIRRSFGNIWAFTDTGSRYTPVQRQDPGPDGRIGTSDDGAFVTVFNLLNPGQSFPVLTNPGEAVRSYDAVQVIGEKRLSRNWQLLGAYTWSRTRGTVNNAVGENRAFGSDTIRGGVFYNPNRAINAEGLFPDYPHQVNVDGTYVLPGWAGVSLSGSYYYLSGNAWGRSATIVGLAQGNQVVRIEPRGTNRVDANSQFAVRLEKTFPLGAPGRTAGIYVDVFNLTNQGVALAVQELSGAAFGQPTQWTAPRTVQIAGRFKF